MPPSAQRVSPVTKRAASEARNTTTSAMSPASPTGRSGVWASIVLDDAGRALLRAHRSVSTTPGGHRVDPDPRRPELHGEGPGGGVDGALGGRVGGPAGRADHARHRREVDDRPPAALDHRGQQGGDQQQGRPHVDRQQAVDELGVEVDGGERAAAAALLTSTSTRSEARPAPGGQARPAPPGRPGRPPAPPGRASAGRPPPRAERGSRAVSATRAPARSRATAMAAPMPRRRPGDQRGPAFQREPVHR